MCPGRAIGAAKLAFKALWGFMKPKQLGPRIRIPPRRASARIACSRAAPFGADFPETCGDDNRGSNARFDALLDDLGDGWGRRYDYGQIHR
jgi:hypothetical protein